MLQVAARPAWRCVGAAAATCAGSRLVKRTISTTSSSSSSTASSASTSSARVSSTARHAKRPARSLTQLPARRRRKQAGKQFLGFDINTRSTGVAVLSSSGQLLYWGTVDTHRVDSVFAKADLVTERVQQVQALLPADHWHAGVEQYLKSFGRGFQTRSLFKLAELNTIISYQLWRLTGQEPMRLPPNQIRGHFGLVRGNIPSGGAGIKRAVWEYVRREHVPSAEWQLTRLGNPTADQFDMTDAYLVARYVYDTNLAREAAPDAVA